MFTYLKNSSSLSLIFTQTLLPPPTCFDGSLAFPWKYHFLHNSFRFWPLLQSLSNFKGKEEKSANSLFPTVLSRYLNPYSLSTNSVPSATQRYGRSHSWHPSQRVCSESFMKEHQAICSDFLDTAIRTKKRYLTQGTAVRFSLSLRNLVLEYVWHRMLWKTVLKIAWKRKYIHS